MQEAGSYRLVSRPRTLNEDSRLLTKRDHILLNERWLFDVGSESNAIMKAVGDAERACFSIVVETGVLEEVCPVNVASVFGFWWADVADPCRALCKATSRWLCSGNELRSVGRMRIVVWEILHRGYRILVSVLRT